MIVGAGILGASLAYALSQRGQDVTVLEQSLPASAASSKSFAWLNANFPDTAAYFELRREEWRAVVLRNRRATQPGATRTGEAAAQERDLPFGGP